MNSFYDKLLSELPAIGKALQTVPTEVQDAAFNMLIDELKAKVSNKEFSIEAASVESGNAGIVTDKVKTNEKLSKLRAKLFERTSATDLETATDADSFRADVEDLTDDDLKDVLFYTKGQTIKINER